MQIGFSATPAYPVAAQQAIQTSKLTTPLFSGIFDHNPFYKEGVDDVLDTNYKQEQSFLRVASENQFTGYEILERLSEACNRRPLSRFLSKFIRCRGYTLEQIAANARISRDKASLNAMEDGLDDLSHMGLAVKVRHGRNPEYRITRYGLASLRHRRQEFDQQAPEDIDS